MKRFLNKSSYVSLGLLIILIAVLASIVSTGLTISYFSTLTPDSTTGLVVTGFIVLLQSMVLIGSIAKGLIYIRSPQHYRTITIFTKLCFIVSVLSTVSFFNTFSKLERIEVIKDILNLIPFLNLQGNEWVVMNLTNMTLIWIACIIIDLMAMYFPSIGFDLITGTKTKRNVECNDYITKVIKLITYYPKNVIDKKCNELGIVICNECNECNELCNEDSVIKLRGCNNNEVITPNSVTKKEINNLDNDIISECNEKCNERNEECNEECNEENVVMKNVMKKKECNELCNELCNEENECNEHSLHVMKDVMNLCNEIDNYVMRNYEIGQTIIVKELKEKFGLKPNDRKWNDKIKHNLKTCEYQGKKLIRIKQNNISLVK